tara:strand:- start:14 stop:247 length:234 start_codon:yes stop_codon:yes gene_type:complete
MNHCKDCKHFNAKGECNRILGPQDRGIENIHRQRFSDDEMSVIDEYDVLAVCVDGSDYYAKLIVKPDFGCVLWEEKK